MSEVLANTEAHTTDLRAASPRKRALYKHLRTEGYVCTVGRDFARKDLLDVTELSPGQTDEQVYEQIAEATRSFLQKHTSGLVIILPEEPASYDELKAIKEQRQADIITAVIMQAIVEKRADIEPVLRKLREVRPEETASTTTKDSEDASEQKEALGAINPIVVAYGAQIDAGNEEYPTEKDTLRIRSIIAKFLSKNPNAVAEYEGDGLFTITLSSVFADENEKERTDARALFGIENIPHQRFSPVTCLFINWHSEVVRVMNTPTGEQIQKNKVHSPFFLDANAMLSERYKRFDAAFDAYLLLGYRLQKILTEGLPPEFGEVLSKVEEKKFQALYKRQSLLLEDRLRHLRGEISDEDFENRCQSWDEFLREQMMADQQMLFPRLGIPVPPSLSDKNAEQLLDALPSAPKPIRNTEARIGRNDKCSCGSGKKFKNCCMRKKT